RVLSMPRDDFAKTLQIQRLSRNVSDPQSDPASPRTALPIHPSSGSESPITPGKTASVIRPQAIPPTFLLTTSPPTQSTGESTANGGTGISEIARRIPPAIPPQHTRPNAYIRNRKSSRPSGRAFPDKLS